MQFNNLEIEVNQKLQLFVDTGPYQGNYLVKVADISKKNLKITTPYHQGKLVPLRVGLSLEVYFTGKYAAFCFKTQIISRENNNIPVLVLAYPPREVERIQRREFFRLNLKKNLKYRLLEEENGREDFKETFTIDISGGGLKIIISDEDIKIDSHLEIYLEIPELEDVAIKAKVLNIYEKDKMKTVGLEFIEIDERTRDKIISFLFDYQRDMRAKGLL